MKRTQNKQQGFTLIELVIVIVLLAILSVTTAPKFIDLTSDAKGATLDSIGGSMNSAMELIYARALIKGEHTGTGLIQISGVDIPLYNGYPSVQGSDSFAQINAQVKAWLEIDAVDRNTARRNRNAATFFTDKSTRNNQIYIFYTADYDQKSVTFKCQIRYENPETTTPQKPTISIETDACI